MRNVCRNDRASTRGSTHVGTDETLGTSVGAKEGRSVGIWEGMELVEGIALGTNDGCSDTVGSSEGWTDTDGPVEGLCDTEGAKVGSAVGLLEGLMVGPALCVGLKLGLCVGRLLGFSEGTNDG
mmetsp:Transcript_15540/g.32120  ORF Transcript_15540/g.32120 Transcript_15540/m.32120 type:complete len:124 (-) Transcript_15540:399-770(-)